MAGRPGVGQIYAQLNAAGYAAKPVLLGDGVCATMGMWRELTLRVGLIVRSAHHRRPPPLRATGCDRPRLYGDHTAPCMTFKGQAMSPCLTSIEYLWCFRQENRTQQPTLLR